MGKSKIPMEYIKGKRPRKLCFDKRQLGLVKKAMELSILCGAKVGIFIIAEGGTSLVEFYSSPRQELEAEVAKLRKETHYDLTLDHYEGVTKHLTLRPVTDASAAEMVSVDGVRETEAKSMTIEPSPKKQKMCTDTISDDDYDGDASHLLVSPPSSSSSAAAKTTTTANRTKMNLPVPPQQHSPSLHTIAENVPYSTLQQLGVGSPPSPPTGAPSTTDLEVKQPTLAPWNNPSSTNPQQQQQHPPHSHHGLVPTPQPSANNRSTSSMPGFPSPSVYLQQQQRPHYVQQVNQMTVVNNFHSSVSNSPIPQLGSGFGLFAGPSGGGGGGWTPSSGPFGHLNMSVEPDYSPIPGGAGTPPSPKELGAAWLRESIGTPQGSYAPMQESPNPWGSGNSPMAFFGSLNQQQP